ncbi:MAG TPA: hypothetical protein VFL88_00280 [Gemmatimonadales bacterium]|nr:hypothetical protein [Gemmatimonadales bacterium]
MRRTGSLCSLLLLAAVMPLAAQQVPVQQLARPEVEFPDPFDQVTSVRELRDGRLIVADLYARAVSLVDFASGQATAIGREGQGPKEFGFPVALVPLPNDTTWLVDPAQNRFLVILPNGTPSGTVAFPDEFGGMARVKGADARGRIYAQGTGFTLGPGSDPRALPDSAPVVAWDRAARSVTPVGKVKIPAVAVSTSGSGGSRSVMMRQQPFPLADDWAVTSAGRVGFVRSGTYHVEWGAPAPRVGPPVAFKPVPVTAADKKELEDRMKDSRGALRITRTDGNGSGQASSGPPPSQPAEPQVDWPEQKPPFVPTSAITSPEGEIWVERSQPAGAPELVDVFGPAGNLLRQVKLPPRTRLVAVGAKGIYAARTDDDGLWYLQRYKKP